MQFNFGKNWQKYLDDCYNDQRFSRAVKSLQSFLGRQDLKDMVFMDFGCGSGIFSLAAYKLGAKKVISIDVNQEAVQCCKTLKKQNDDPDNWQVLQGSLIDDEFVNSLEKADIVYCWGVAHHTGKMWHALENLLLPLKPNGLLYIAIYNKVGRFWSSKRWQGIKKYYNKSNESGKKIMELCFVGYHYARLVARLKNPFSASSQNIRRGMALRTNLVDWLGGYPYEYATVKEIFKFYVQENKLDLINIETTNYRGCNQFLFKIFYDAS